MLFRERDKFTRVPHQLNQQHRPRKVRAMSAKQVNNSDTRPASGNKPVKVFCLRSVKVSVFENRVAGDQPTAFYKTAVQRIYKDGEEWKTTTSLGRDDLPVVRLLLQRAWEFILETEAGGTREEPEHPTD
jgi:hypothetical protein